MAAAKKKTDKAKEIEAAIHKQFGKESMTLLREDTSHSVREVVPTGIGVLDHYLFGIHGAAVGRIGELFSEEGAGKTSLGHTFLAAGQRAGGVSALIETEHAFDPERASLFGVNTDDLLVGQPDHLSDVLLKIEGVLAAIKAAKPEGPSVIVWDSVAATPTLREFEEGLSGKDKVGDRAKELSKAMRVITRQVKESRVALVCINQIRDNIGVMFGADYTTAGGHAIKFHSSWRLQLFSSKSVKDPKTSEHTGKAVTFLCVKNRLSPPFRKAKVRLDFATGWNEEWSTLEHAKRFGKAPDRARGAKAHADAVKKLGWA